MHSSGTNSRTKGRLNISAVGPRFGSTKLATLIIRSALTLAVLSALLLIAAPAQAQTETVLYSFGSQTGDGYGPVAGLIFDKAGNLYGTARAGGAYSNGTVFELTAAGSEKVLYSFGSQPGDGAVPYGGLIFDKKGNLYGTTQDGGAYGGGTVFELTAAGTEKVLYSFSSQPGDGINPLAGLIFDKKRNLYGTTLNGGAYDRGTVFELTAKGAEKILYSFGSQPGDGSGPYAAGVIFDTMGNLYGTTCYGGAYGEGTVFELTAAGTEKVLYSFGSQPGDGQMPEAGLTFDKKGNLYGTTSGGGAYGIDEGTVFELTAAGTETVLYSFGGQPDDGSYLWAGLTFDKKGNLYGVTVDGGAHGGGTVFEVTAAGKEKNLYSFGSEAGDGNNPYGGLIFDKKGNLYGTTLWGGAYAGGTVFKLVP
jgi:uncharacterized repeat protein (TIGR03803 family)